MDLIFRGVKSVGVVDVGFMTEPGEIGCWGVK